MGEGVVKDGGGGGAVPRSSGGGALHAPDRQPSGGGAGADPEKGAAADTASLLGKAVSSAGGAPLMSAGGAVAGAGAGGASHAQQTMLTVIYGLTNLSSVVMIVVANKMVCALCMLLFEALIVRSALDSPAEQSSVRPAVSGLRPAAAVLVHT